MIKCIFLDLSLNINDKFIIYLSLSLENKAKYRVMNKSNFRYWISDYLSMGIIPQCSAYHYVEKLNNSGTKWFIYSYSISTYVLLENIQRTPGDVWMINGPLVYIPPVEVQVQDRRYGYAVHCSTV